ncbi:MAG: hypothetical protein KF906_05080 [Actinobacteria bacterium]|nr:hypothetical protein [Actinomycetota bacterium]
MAALSHGMNVDEVEELGRFLKAKAAEVSRIGNDTNARVRNGSAWTGPDANRFKGQWWPKHHADIKAIADALDGFGQAALNNASEQRATSDGGTTGSSAAGSAGSRSVWRGVSGLLEFVELGRTGKDAYDVIKNVAGPKSLLDGVPGGGWSGPALSAGVGTLSMFAEADKSGWGSASTMWEEVDLVGGTGAEIAGTVVGGPAGGLAAGVAWDGSTYVGGVIGTAAYNATEDAWATGTGTSVGMYDSFFLMRDYGVSDLDQLPFDQQASVASEMVQRREGWSGLYRTVGDLRWGMWEGLKEGIR